MRAGYICKQPDKVIQSRPHLFSNDINSPKSRSGEPYFTIAFPLPKSIMAEKRFPFTLTVQGICL
jgi:hypothetical protein